MDEIDKTYLDIENRKETIKESIVNRINNFKKENMFNKENVDYNTGEHINHTEYGIGVVISVDKSIITVAFPHPIGIKKLMKNHKSISKIDK